MLYKYYKKKYKYNFGGAYSKNTHLHKHYTFCFLNHYIQDLTNNPEFATAQSYTQVRRTTRYKLLLFSEQIWMFIIRRY